MAVLINLLPIHLWGQNLTNPSRPHRYYYLEEIFKHVTDAGTATREFYAALTKLYYPDTKNRDKIQRLYWDIVHIISPEKKKVWQALQTDSARVAFLERFWLGNDFTPATFANERLVEHYTRLRYARDHYTWIEPPGYDDRGEVYVKYGPPDDHVEDVLNTSSVPVISWVYFRYSGNINFDFIDEGYGFRKDSQLTNAARTVQPIFYVLAMESLLRRRMLLSPRYFELYSSLMPSFAKASGDPGALLMDTNNIIAQMERAALQYAAGTQNDQSRLPPIMTEIVRRTDDLPCVLDLAKFRGENARIDLVALYGWHNAALKGKKDTLQVTVVTAIRDTTLNISTSQQAMHAVLVDSVHKTADFVLTESHTLAPGKYYFALDVDNPAGKQRGLRDFSVVLGRYPESEMALSSVLLAREVSPASGLPPEGDTIIRRDLAIKPYPFASLSRTTPIFVYFEIYHLLRDADGETFYEVEYKIASPAKKGLGALLASLNPFAGSATSIALAQTRHGPSATEPTYLQLDMRQLKPGEYDLQVRVTDRHAHTTKDAKVEVVVE